MKEYERIIKEALYPDNLVYQFTGPDLEKLVKAVKKDERQKILRYAKKYSKDDIEEAFKKVQKSPRNLDSGVQEWLRQIKSEFYNYLNK